MGQNVGPWLGAKDGDELGAHEGWKVGPAVGAREGDAVGVFVGVSVHIV